MGQAAQYGFAAGEFRGARRACHCTSVIADAPPVPQDTTIAPLTWSTTHAPVTGDLIDIDQERHKLYVGHGATDTIEQFDVSDRRPNGIGHTRFRAAPLAS